MVATSIGVRHGGISGTEFIVDTEAKLTRLLGSGNPRRDELAISPRLVKDVRSQLEVLDVTNPWVNSALTIQWSAL
jgi:hypothetical protein